MQKFNLVRVYWIYWTVFVSLVIHLSKVVTYKYCHSRLWIVYNSYYLFLILITCLKISDVGVINHIDTGWYIYVITIVLSVINNLVRYNSRIKPFEWVASLCNFIVIDGWSGHSVTTGSRNPKLIAEHTIYIQWKNEQKSFGWKTSCSHTCVYSK